MTDTFKAALQRAQKAGTSHADDAAFMAQLCETVFPTAVGAVSPRLVWEGAQKTGLTAQQLARLASENPRAVEDLMWL